MDVKAVECDFSFSRFERAYFRDAIFSNCKFTGARFEDCNFRGVTFVQCDFKYADFSGCLIDAKQVVSNLPYEPNIRSEALRNLRANATSVGDYKIQGMLVLQEIQASYDHYCRVLKGADTYYQKKYPTFVSKLKAGGHILAYHVSRFVWGHGEKPQNILFSIVVFLLSMSLINFWSVLPQTSWASAGAGINVFQYYFVVVARYLYIGLFITVLYRKISYR